MGDDDDDHMGDDDQDQGDGCIWWFPGNLSPQIFTLALETLNAALNFSLFFLLLSSSILSLGRNLKIYGVVGSVSDGRIHKNSV